MMRFASLFLLIALGAIALFLFLKLLAGGASFIAMAGFVIFLILFIGFLTLDILKRRKAKK